MSRWKLYLRSRKAINDILMVGIAPIIICTCLLVYIFNKEHHLSTSTPKTLIPIFIVFMIISFPITYYKYLDDIFFKKIKVYIGYITRIGSSRKFSPYSRTDPIYRNYPELFSIKRKIIYCSEKGNSSKFRRFDCFIKKMWNEVKVGDLVRITYLQYSKIVTDIEILNDFNKNTRNIHKDLSTRTRGETYIPDEELKLDSELMIKKIFKAIIFTAIGVLLIDSTLMLVWNFFASNFNNM